MLYHIEFAFLLKRIPLCLEGRFLLVINHNLIVFNFIKI